MNHSVVAIMVNHINDYLRTSPVHNLGTTTFKEPVNHITCKDGTRISVQASKGHYCEPRDDNGPWTHVEVMMAEDPVYFDIDDADSNIAAYVPIESVAKEILYRGNARLTGH
jgi:hypothetical protein